MADVRSLLRNEQASRRITHPSLSYTKSGLLNCLVCSLIIKSESLWEGHLKSANHRKNLQKVQNGAPQDGSGNASKKRKVSDDREDVRKKRKSTNQEEEDIDEVLGGRLEEERKPELLSNNEKDDLASSAIPEHISPSYARQPLPAEAVVATPPPPPQPKPHLQIDEDEWAAFEREVVPLAHQKPPPDPNDYSSATISAAPLSAAELAAQTAAERQQRRDADVEDEKAEEESRLVEEFEVMEGLEERVKRLKEKREALRMAVGTTESSAAMEEAARPVEAEGQQKPAGSDEEDDDSDELDEWGFA